MAVAACSKCNRTFNFESLTVHERICRGQNKSKGNQKVTIANPSNFPSDSGEESTAEFASSVVPDFSTSKQIKSDFHNVPQSKFVVCDVCGKTFTIHSLDKHKVACDKKTARERQEHEAQRKHDAGPSHVGRLPGAVCYICGRNFGTQSIEIHEKQCLEKFRQQNNELPKKERKPEPIKPQTNKETLEQMVKEQKLAGNKDYNSQAAMNDINAAAYNQNLVQCSNCLRTFNADALKFHVKACTNSKPARKVGDVVMHQKPK